MASPVTRAEILDFVTYNERRDAMRPAFLAAKAKRRVLVGDTLTFLFENHETVRYQVLEMLRTEQIVREDDIAHEIETYNELLGGPGEIGCTLLIGIDDAAKRAAKLQDWLELPKHIYLKLSSGTKVRPIFDERQIGEDRLSSVQYLRFDTKGEVPVAVGCDLDELAGETQLTQEQREALRIDLAS